MLSQPDWRVENQVIAQILEVISPMDVSSKVILCIGTLNERIEDCELTVYFNLLFKYFLLNYFHFIFNFELFNQVRKVLNIILVIHLGKLLKDNELVNAGMNLLTPFFFELH